MTAWFEERLYPGTVHRLRMDRILHSEQTDEQDLVIFENDRYGRVLALDGIVQTTEADEPFYHEMLVHVPLVAHPRARRVLVIGGGDGGAIRRALMHDIEAVTLVEIDPAVIEMSKRYLPKLSGDAFDDPRLELVIADGCRYVAETEARFDVVIIDSTDPVGPGRVLFTAEFYRDCKRVLNPGGILVTQNGVPFMQADEVRDGYPKLKASFADVAFYLTEVPSYQGGHMALGFATDDPSLRRQTAEQLADRAAPLAGKCEYYGPAVHAAAFALPPFIERLFA
ncbi:polyamine aminopropyltransferase [Oceanibacterium hippocampi]|uniref:Polyamine aminopropyltransferase n=1 Tax=Oceanibacterium hippocampi TaxID=745714 RepID=A0A1Y5S4L3_9PROT|nr:polyamine aminopropyltransferase [Oceanibacterium hippocampi]SLN31552.1 Spermidine synthase [Oceanibacterium hippocampi]